MAAASQEDTNWENVEQFTDDARTAAARCTEREAYWATHPNVSSGFGLQRDFRSHCNSKFTATVAERTIDLQRMLLGQVGDDVVRGQVGMPAAMDEEIDSMPGVNRPTPRFDSRGFTINVRGADFRFPLTSDDADTLYHYLDQSCLGVEGRGTVLDESRRKSREVAVVVGGHHHRRRGDDDDDDDDAECILPAPLGAFFFPEAVEAIRTVLCPSAAQVAVVPYKLVAYAPGDFFGRHVDSTNDPRHFGTIALHLPTAAAYNRGLVMACTHGDSDVASNDGYRDGRMSDDHDGLFFADGEADSHFEGQQSPVAASPTPSVVVGGELRFFMGRSGAERPAFLDGPLASSRDALDNDPRGTYDVPTDEAAMRRTVDLAHYTRAQISAGRQRPAAASGGASIQTGVSAGPPTIEKHQRYVRPTAPWLPLNYAAWLTDVPHEVTMVQAGYRVVLTYKLMRRGVAPLRIPMRLDIERSVMDIVRAMRDATAAAAAHQLEQQPMIADQSSSSLLAAGSARLATRSGTADPARVPTAIGVLLRHAYPPAGLEPAALKGLDAVLYDVVAPHHTVDLMSVAVMRNGDTPSTPWRIEEKPFERYCFVTTDRQQVIPTFGNRESGDDEAFSRFPIVANAAWVQLGLGGLLGGGRSYGNWDCGCLWWYREAVMLIRPGPTWRRRRWPIVARHKGGRRWQELFANWVPLQIVCEFL